jgi:hypothetical protein
VTNQQDIGKGGASPARHHCDRETAVRHDCSQLTQWAWINMRTGMRPKGPARPLQTSRQRAAPSLVRIHSTYNDA